MTLKKSMGVMFLYLIIISNGCTKDTLLNETKNSDSTVYPLEGLWIGKYNYGSSPSSNGEYFSLIIKPNKNLIVETRFTGNQQLANGVWSISSDSTIFNTDYNYIYPSGVTTSQRVLAKWYKTGTLIGTWQNTFPANGVSGTFAVKRVN